MNGWMGNDGNGSGNGVWEAWHGMDGWMEWSLLSVLSIY